MKTYRVTFQDKDSYQQFITLPYQFTSQNEAKNRARISICDEQLDQLIQDIAKLNVEDFHEIPFTLEQYFMKFYKEERVFEGVK